MKILIAVKSCQEMWNRGAHDKIRKSWGRLFPWRATGNVNMDLRFFLGGTPVHPLKDDEIHLWTRDDYNGLSAKGNTIFRWAVGKAYDYVVLVDTDTFINPIELSKLSWGFFDYAGEILPFGSKGGFAFGGCGFAVSHNAMNIVLNNEITHDMDDINIGNILLHRPQPDVRILPRVWDRHIGWHFPKSTYAVKSYNPDFPWMHMMAEQHLGFPKNKHEWTVFIGGTSRLVFLELSSQDRDVR